LPVTVSIRAAERCTSANHPGRLAGERLEARPVDEVPGPDPPRQPFRQEATEAAAGAGVDPDHSIPAVESRQLDLVGADQPRAVDVDQLVVEDVVAERDLVGAPLERAQVEFRLVSVTAPGAIDATRSAGT
jgi:hypothetical protein